MAIWDRARDAFVDSRRKDEEYHARAMHEVQSGHRRDGLWAKAVMSLGGDEEAVKIAYFKLLVQAIRDDDHVEKRSAVFSENKVQQSTPQLPSSLGQSIQKPKLLKSLWFWFLTIVATLIIVFGFLPAILDGRATGAQWLVAFFWLVVIQYALKRLFPTQAKVADGQIDTALDGSPIGNTIAKWLSIILLLLVLVLIIFLLVGI